MWNLLPVLIFFVAVSLIVSSAVHLRWIGPSPNNINKTLRCTLLFRLVFGMLTLVYAMDIFFSGNVFSPIGSSDTKPFPCIYSNGAVQFLECTSFMTFACY